MEQASLNIEPKTLAILNSAEIPVVKSIAKELNDLILDRHSASKDIADVIKKDAALTAKVLKVANSTGFNATREVRSVNKAVELLGNQGVKSVFISVMMIDSLVKRPQVQKRLMHCLGRAFFASVLAKNLVEARGQSATDDVLVAALLQHLGEMLFWSSTHPKVRNAAHRVSEGELPRKVLEDSLGVKLNKLSLYFAKKWSLSKLLIETLKREPGMSSKARCILVADATSETLQSGWGTKDFTAILAKCSKLLRCEPEKALSFIQDSLHEARDLAEFYGVDQAREFLEAESEAIETHLSPIVIRDDDEETATPSQEKMQATQQEPETVNEPTKAAFNALQDHGPKQTPPQHNDFIEHLSQLFDAKLSINAIFRAILDGLHDDMAFDRIVLALANEDRTQIKARHIYGNETQNWTEDFKFEIGGTAGNIFGMCIDQKRAIRLRASDNHYQAWIPENLVDILKYDGEFIIAPLFAGNKPLAVLYVDCFDKQCDISREQLADLEHLITASNSGFSRLADH